jgi:hypothetical protein
MLGGERGRDAGVVYYSEEWPSEADDADGVFPDER